MCIYIYITYTNFILLKKSQNCLQDFSDNDAWTIMKGIKADIIPLPHHQVKNPTYFPLKRKGANRFRRHTRALRPGEKQVTHGLRAGASVSFPNPVPPHHRETNPWPKGKQKCGWRGFREKSSKAIIRMKKTQENHQDRFTSKHHSASKSCS